MMKKIELGRTVQILANVGVIAGIVFLAVEIRQNNQMMVSQTRSDIAHGIADMLLRSSLSDYMEAVVLPESLAQAGSMDSVRLFNFQLANLRLWENIYYQWSNGLYEDSEYEGEKRVWAGNINRPSMQVIFCGSREAFSPGFAQELESLMDDPC